MKRVCHPPLVWVHGVRLQVHMNMGGIIHIKWYFQPFFGGTFISNGTSNLFSKEYSCDIVGGESNMQNKYVIRGDE